MSDVDDQPAADGEIIHADPRARAITLAVSLAILVLGAVLLWWLGAYQKELLDLVKRNQPAAVAKALRLADTAACLGGLGLVAAGVWFARLARRIGRSGRFPPPGMKVIRDTPLRTGAKARAMARVAVAVAVVLLLAGTLGMWMFHELVHSLLKN